MNQEYLLNLLKSTFHQKIVFYSFVCVLIVIWLIVGTCMLHHTKRKKKVKTQEKARYVKLLTCSGILAVTMAFLIPARISELHRDITKIQIATVQGYYSFDATNSAWPSNGKVYVEMADETLTLELPAHWAQEDFPEGSYYGTIWYGLESGIILQFVPN